MAETVYKKISELPNATLPLVGTEYVELSATGASKRGLWSGLFGAGWWAKLAAAFSAFKALDSDHADNADTLGAGLETPTDFHDATQLVGAVPLANIPDELTGKNADSVDGFHAGGITAGTLPVYRGSVISGPSSASDIGALFKALVPEGEICRANGTIYSAGSLRFVVAVKNNAGSDRCSYYCMKDDGTIEDPVTFINATLTVAVNIF